MATEQFETALQTMNQSDRDRAYELVGQWFMNHADKLRGGKPHPQP